jgi:hypothetical protein
MLTPYLPRSFQARLGCWRVFPEVSRTTVLSRFANVVLLYVSGVTDEETVVDSYNPIG